MNLNYRGFMWYYIFISFLLLSGLFITRLNSAYHPDLIFKKHIVINNKKLQKLLIFQSDPTGNTKNKNKAENRNRFLILGIVFYIIWLLILLFSIIFLSFGPQTAIEPFEFDDEFYISTLKQMVVFYVDIIFCGWCISFYCLNIIKSSSIKIHKMVSIIYLMCIIILFAACGAGVFEFIKFLVTNLYI